MGASNKKIEQLHSLLKLIPDQWQYIDSKGLVEYYEYRGFSTSIPHLMQTELNTVQTSSHSQLEQLQIYHYRKESKNSLVKCYGADLIPHGKICGSIKSYKVLTERFVKVFVSFPELTILQTLYVLKQALDGYHILYKKLGEFEIRNNMMGINSIGEFKVWCNSNPSKNHPENEVAFIRQSLTENPDNQFQELFRNTTESSMVAKILSLIESKCTIFGKYPPQLANRIKSVMNGRGQGFKTISREIQEFMKEESNVIPNRLERLLKSSNNGHSSCNGKSLEDTGCFKLLEESIIANDQHNKSPSINVVQSPSPPINNNEMFGVYLNPNSQNISYHIDNRSYNNNSNSYHNVVGAGKGQSIYLSNLPSKQEKYKAFVFPNRDTFLSNDNGSSNISFPSMISNDGYVNSYLINQQMGGPSTLSKKYNQLRINNNNNNNNQHNQNNIISNIPRLRPTTMISNGSSIYTNNIDSNIQFNIPSNIDQQSYSNNTIIKNINRINMPSNLNSNAKDRKSVQSHQTRPSIRVSSLDKLQNKAQRVTFQNKNSYANLVSLQMTPTPKQIFIQTQPPKCRISDNVNNDEDWNFIRGSVNDQLIYTRLPMNSNYIKKNNSSQLDVNNTNEFV